MVLGVIGSGSDGNCYYLRNDRECLVLDAGITFKKTVKGLDYKVSDISGVLVTHTHTDHSYAIKDFLKYGIKVGGNPDIEGITGLLSKHKYKIGGFKVVPFDVPHDDCPCYAYLIWHSDIEACLLYATDFGYLPHNLKGFNIGTMLVECNHQDKYLPEEEFKFRHSAVGHSELETVKKIVEADKTEHLRNIVLCHLSRNAAEPEEMKEEIAKIAGDKVRVFIASPGLKIQI